VACPCMPPKFLTREVSIYKFLIYVEVSILNFTISFITIKSRRSYPGSYPLTSNINNRRIMSEDIMAIT